MARPLWVSARVACTAVRGQGATVLSPLSASPERVRVSGMFSSRRTPKRLFVCRLRRCKTAAVPVDLSSRVNVLSGTACSTVLSACRFFVACPESHISCSSVSPGDPSHKSSGRYRDSLRSFKVGMRRNGGGFAPPSPSQSQATVPADSFHREHRDPVTQQMCQQGFRLDASRASR